MSSKHIMALSRLGAFTLPLHLRLPAASTLSSRTGRAMATIEKYSDAPACMSRSAPSHTGSQGAMHTPITARTELNISPDVIPCLTILRAVARSSAPTLWATWTEKPEAKAVHRPPKSHMVVDTNPTMADSFVPR